MVSGSVIPSRVTRDRVDTLIPWMLMRSTLSRLAEEKGHRVMGVFKCGGAQFQRDCNARKSTGKQSSGKGKQSKSWSKSEGKGKSKEKKGKSKGKLKGTKSAKGSHKGKTSKTCLSNLENSKSETSSETQESGHVCTNDNSWFHDGWRRDEWNDGWSYDVDWCSVGWH